MYLYVYRDDDEKIMNSVHECLLLLKMFESNFIYTRITPNEIGDD